MPSYFYITFKPSVFQPIIVITGSQNLFTYIKKYAMTADEICFHGEKMRGSETVLSFEHVLRQGKSRIGRTILLTDDTNTVTQGSIVQIGLSPVTIKTFADIHINGVVIKESNLIFHLTNQDNPNCWQLALAMREQTRRTSGAQIALIKFIVDGI